MPALGHTNMSSLLEYWKSQTPLTQFLVKAVFFYVLWIGIYDKIIQPHFPVVNDVVTRNIAEIGSGILRASGYDAKSVPVPHMVKGHANYIYINNKPYVVIEDGCNGLVLMYLFAAFIVAFPGPRKDKYWYIPLGIFVIYWINILRVALLSIVIVNYEKAVIDFHHKYTFQVTVYAVIFIFWVIWANKFSKGAFDTPPAEAA